MIYMRFIHDACMIWCNASQIQNKDSKQNYRQTQTQTSIILHGKMRKQAIKTS